MSNTRRRKAALATLAMYFVEKGKVLTQAEYIASTDKPIPFSGLRSVFRAYSRMVPMLLNEQPELLAMIAKKKETPAPVVAPTPVPAAPKAPTPAPKVAVKPAAKPAVKEEKDNE